MRASLGTELMLLESTCHAPVVPTLSLAPASHGSHQLACLIHTSCSLVQQRQQNNMLGLVVVKAHGEFEEGAFKFCLCIEECMQWCERGGNSSTAVCV